ncbi:15614_t:CDS:10, partial [Gigaspora margarita]
MLYQAAQKQIKTIFHNDDVVILNEMNFTINSYSYLFVYNQLHSNTAITLFDLLPNLLNDSTELIDEEIHFNNQNIVESVIKLVEKDAYLDYIKEISIEIADFNPIGVLHPVKIHPERNLHQLFRGFVEELNMDNIPIPVLVSIPVYKKFEANNPEISLCIYKWHNQNEYLDFCYVSERRKNEYKQLVYIDSKHKEQKYLCHYCLHVYFAKKGFKEHLPKYNKSYLYRGPDALKKFIKRIKGELLNIQADLFAPAEMIMVLGDLETYNNVTECWICKGPFLKPALEVVQKLEEAKYNLLEIKEWESCMEKEYSKKKEVQKKYQEALSALNLKVKDYDHINGNYQGPAYDSYNKKLRIGSFETKIKTKDIYKDQAKRPDIFDLNYSGNLFLMKNKTKGIPIGETVCLKPKMYLVLPAGHDFKTSNDPDSEDPKKKHTEKDPNNYIKALAVKMFSKEEAYTERLENYRKRYEDNDLYSSLEELYELYYHIAKEKNHESSPETIASGVEVSELDSCSICNEEIFLHILKKSFTVLTCGHTVHHLCLKNLRETMFTYPVNNCSAEIEIIEKSLLMRAPSQRSMSIDEGSQDPLIFDKISSKKRKQAKKESHILKDLIKELSTGPEAPQDPVTRKESAVNFNDLYNNITYAETQNEIINQEVITSYYLLGKALENRYDYYKKSNPKQTAQALVNNDIRSQLPNSVSDNLLRKKKEWALKIYDLFSEIGIEKIQRVKSLTVSSISNLSQDEIDQILNLQNKYLLRHIAHFL